MKEQLRAYVRALGADVCGFADAAAFSGAPEGHRPTDIFPACRTVVVFARRIPQGLMEVSPRVLYAYFNYVTPHELDDIAYQTSLYIEDAFGALSVPLPADGPVDDWNAETLTARGVLSMKHAAVLAGLGQLGKNTLLLHPTYGNLLNIGALLTALALPPDPPAESICLAACRRCLDACPTGALDGVTADQQKCRPYTYGVNARGCDVCHCNRCRAVCPMSRGKAHGA